MLCRCSSIILPKFIEYAVSFLVPYVNLLIVKGLLEYNVIMTALL